jgi:molecular chaperone GrpE (heat shock protein)
MRTQDELKLAKWPFLLGDLLLLGAAYFTFYQSKLPMVWWQIGFVVLCVAGGAALAIMPFLLEYRLAAKLAEATALTDAVAQIQKLEKVGEQITSATSRWHVAQEEAEKTAASAKAIADRISAEAKAFSEFLERANESEKAALRLEVEKARRAENDWLQSLVRVLDHVFALNQGAMRSGQPNLIQQLGNFQTACREAVRRVGLTPFSAADSEPFDAQRHQLLDGDGKVPPGSLVEETVAAGYTFQGRLLRPALVKLAGNGGVSSPNGPAPAESENPQRQLPLAAAAQEAGGALTASP